MAIFPSCHVLAVTQKIDCPLFLGVDVSLLDVGENDERKDAVGIRFQSEDRDLTSDIRVSVWRFSLFPDVLAVTQQVAWSLFHGVNVSLLDAGENDERKDAVGIRFQSEDRDLTSDIRLSVWRFSLVPRAGSDAIDWLEFVSWRQRFVTRCWRE